MNLEKRLGGWSAAWRGRDTEHERQETWSYYAYQQPRQICDSPYTVITANPNTAKLS